MQDKLEQDQQDYSAQIVCGASASFSFIFTLATIYYASVGNMLSAALCGSAVGYGATIAVVSGVSFWGKISKASETSDDVSQMATDRTQLMKWNG
jgi:hypothetical protein